MLQEILKILRPEDPMKQLADEFKEMFSLACGMVISAGELFFDKRPSEEELIELRKCDVTVNKLERLIRRGIVTHLSLSMDRQHVPYSLALMSLVKDVERLGDYAKNLSEVSDLYRGDFPEDPLVDKLNNLRREVEKTCKLAPEILMNSDAEAARPMIQAGVKLAKESDELLELVARANHPSDLTVAIVLGARYYKRIISHLVNLLTSVVMPIHKIDYVDDEDLDLG